MLETEKKSEAKFELVEIANDLMPAGKANYTAVVKYPMIRQLEIEKGRKPMILILSLMVRDFCSSVNVVRNMNEDQIIEAAAMLLNECGNFRLEDYVMMFTMAKRGELADIRDRIDLQVITTMLDNYWIKRNEAGEKAANEEVRHLDSLGSTARIADTSNPNDLRLQNSMDKFSESFRDLKQGLIDNKQKTNKPNE